MGHPCVAWSFVSPPQTVPPHPTPRHPTAHARTHPCASQVEELIRDANEETAAAAEGEGPPKSMRLPLVRLKVEHAGFNTVRT